MRKKLVDAREPAEIFDHRRVTAGEGAELLFATWIGEAAGIKNESAAIARLIERHGMVEGEAEDLDSKARNGRRGMLQFVAGRRSLKCVEKFG